MARSGTRTRGNYKREDITYGLTTVIAFAGNCEAASRALEAEGKPIPASTLRVWRCSSFRDEYLELEAQHRPEIDARAVSQARTLVEKLGEAEELAIDRTIEALQAGEINAKDAAATLKNLTISKGVNIDKIDVREGKATSRVEITAGEDLIRSLEAAGLLAPQTEIDDANVVETTPVLIESGT